MSISVVSLFSGAGGIDIGFKEAGFRTILATDNWDIACETLRKNNISETVICDDIRSLSFSAYKNVDVVVGGPPCPPYSQTRHYLINKKSGLDDEKAGFAVPEFFRAIKEMSPKVFLFENVDGFTHKTNISAFEYLKTKSKDLNYNIFFRKINCADYGVPQTRNRFICVGVKKGEEDFEFPEPEYADPEKNENDKKNWVTCREAIGEFDNITDEEKEQRPGSKDYELLLKIPPGDNYLFFTEKRGHPNPIFKWKSRYWTFLLKLSPDRPSWTLQASFSNNQGPFHWRNRFLRIEEIKRLQTFPDDYVLAGDFKEQWRQVGNAVPPLMIKKIAKKIKETYFDARKI